MHDDLHSLIRDALPAEADGSGATRTVAQPCLPLPIMDEEALKIARASLVGACDYFPWAGPLLEAVSLGAGAPAKFATAWGGTESGNDPTPDPAKHEAYVAHIRAMLSESCGWLLSLFDAAGARVLVSPGVFCFMVTQHSAVAFDIPQLVPLTHLTPWAEPDEPKH